MKTFIMITLAILEACICLAADVSGTSQPLNALDMSSLTFRRITTQDGLSGRMVFTVCQDDEGYVWIGTDSGLDRYDGYSIVSYFHDSNDKSSICNSCVTYLYESRDGRLWVGTADGLCAYDKASDTFSTIAGTSSMYVRQISEDNIGCLWVATNNGCLMLKGGKWLHFHANAEQAFHIPDDYVTSVMPYDDDTVWVSAGKYICTYSHKSGNFRFSPIASLAAKIKNTQVFWLSKGDKDEIFIGTNNGLFRYDPSSGSCRPMLDEVVRSITTRKDGTLWVATQNGLHICDDNGFHHYFHIPTDNGSLADNLVWSVNFTKDGNAWIATENGISVTNTDRPLPFISLKSLVTWDISANVQCLLKDSRGRIWLGTTRGTIWYNPDGSENGKEMFQGYNVRDMLEDKDGYMWIATDGGLFSYSLIDGSSASYDIIEPSGQYRSDWIYSIIEDNSGKNIWIGTFDGGVFVVDKQRLLREGKDGPVTADAHYSTSQPTHRLSSNLISGLARDREGNVWIATNDRGLCRIDTYTGEVDEYSADSGSGLGSNNIGGLKTGSDGTIWIFSDAGIFRLDPGSRAISRSAEMISEKVLDIAIQNEYLWITSNTGLERYNTETGSLHKIDTGDAACDALYYDGNKTVYIGCKNGFIPLDTSAMPADTTENVSITGIIVNDAPIRGLGNYGNGVRVDMSAEGVMSLVLPHYCDNFSVQVSTFRFTDSENAIFTYKLDGYDQKTNYLSGSNMISYHDLRPGKYILRISSGGFGSDGDDGTILHVVIQRPWYASATALSAYTLILLLTGVGIYMNAARKKRRTIAEQDDLEEKTKPSNEIDKMPSHSDTDNCDSLKGMVDEKNAPLPPTPRNTALVFGSDRSESSFEAIAGNGYNDFSFTRSQATGFEKNTIESVHPDIILIDDTLSDRECIHACHRIKAAGNAVIPIIVVRKDAKQTDIRNLHLFGADHTISISDTSSPEHLHAIMRNIINSKGSKPEKEDTDTLFLHSLIRAINDNIENENLDTDMLCDMLETTRKQLYRKTMQLTGTTAAEYIKILRLQKASELCRNTTLNISEIIMKVGFSNHSYFTKCFKEEFHTTPKEYINTYRVSNMNS